MLIKGLNRDLIVVVNRHLNDKGEVVPMHDKKAYGEINVGL
jgi:hypothetical protein